MAKQPVPPIESGGIRPQKPLHPGAEIGSGRLDDQVKMIAYQAVGMHLPPRFPADLAQRLHESLPILIIPNNVFPPITTIHHMIDRTSILQSHPPRHGSAFSHTVEVCQYSSLTPFPFSNRRDEATGGGAKVYIPKPYLKGIRPANSWGGEDRVHRIKIKAG